jgi:phosphatidate cytidylyltransferase
MKSDEMHYEQQRPLSSGVWDDFLHRFLSSLAIVVIVLGALLWSPMAFSSVFIAAGLWVLVEWFKLTQIKPWGPLLTMSILGLALGGILGAFYSHWWLVLCVFIGTLAGLISGAQTKRDQIFVTLGFLCASTIALALMYLRQIPVIGLTVVCWIFVIVGTVDTMAFLTGKLVGGPKILPHVSPNKTWAGVLGGTVCATAAGALCIFLAKILGVPLSLEYRTVFLLSFLGAVMAQCGDFLESYLKRLMGVKNTGTLIPGHGGLMDRLDSLCMLSFCTFLIFVFRDFLFFNA